MSSTLDLQFLLRQVQNLLDETRQVRKEIGDIRTLTLQTYDFARRVERRQSEARDDLELTVKMELGGALANLQTSIEASIGRVEAKVDALQDRLEAASPSP
ncbi:hypothetical protein GCM10011390_00510 [Aureimonas endophytica]|uniref:Uncharacterized protein n=1 Tax=Aureimonas endophytica TaxID=2027858 RepID=A0A916ZCF5_9HYPH|nr:hypothetical protein [Aureimonas endophytica]GGD85859.1 hypothetical protein GCM10011390_00510 [Aureimonas endophytica]